MQRGGAGGRGAGAGSPGSPSNSQVEEERPVIVDRDGGRSPGELRGEKAVGREETPLRRGLSDAMKRAEARAAGRRRRDADGRGGGEDEPHRRTPRTHVSSRNRRRAL